MDKRPIDSNAIKALHEMKMEIAKELGVSDTFINNNKLDPVTNIFTAGPVGGLMTRKLVEMGEKELMDEE
ncbi:Small, acid-soluble spore protein, alpha/beta type [[Clostridium] ultunense Esp]|uniref:Small, acid-soluble spore protein, alpha/beta type n=1 Tax=[Clostridium] ultunense Esp TaxID=1288971 RepID=M1Z4F0_9FIRM|nr:small, acid-soluble spore protein, alpha/beta type [Schnuerera ultunensis]CCQ92634.1 Small, acid-soluble spore protein, alpha/beta type [[Clostridium] ultunense Esp]SHD77918.1 Small, acid-soluble spore protein, alpha/beta type [[Clostridium] ultunense Esp]